MLLTKMDTEYDHIDIIGTTHEIHNNETDRIMNGYYHQQEVSTVKSLLLKVNNLNYDKVLDLGCSIGTWYNDYKKFGFKKIIEIDISKERAMKAKEREDMTKFMFVMHMNYHLMIKV